MKLVTSALLASGAMCSAGIPESEPAPQPEVEFTVVGAVETQGSDTVSVQATAPGEVILVGRISTPTPCYQLESELRGSGDDLTLEIAARALPRICPQVLAAYEYRARLYRLGVGNYRMTVVHAYPESGWEGRSYEIRVEIPG